MRPIRTEGGRRDFLLLFASCFYGHHPSPALHPRGAAGSGGKGFPAPARQHPLLESGSWTPRDPPSGSETPGEHCPLRRGRSYSSERLLLCISLNFSNSNLFLLLFQPFGSRCFLLLLPLTSLSLLLTFQLCLHSFVPDQQFMILNSLRYGFCLLMDPG